MMKLIKLSLVILTLLLTAAAQKRPNCESGREGQVIVHLFEWKWDDIAEECERVLGPKGFCGVQVSPPNEHRIVTSPNRPWWERYQPISYKLDSRSGNRQQFISMVDRCNAAGVRIYIDAVVNHMAGVDSGSGTGSGGSYYSTQEMRFDGVPFGPNDFGKTCPTSSGNIQDYNNVEQVRNCRLLGLLDLDGGSDYVRGKIADFFNDMLEIGIDGYRIDAAKHMWPGDIQGTLERTRDSKFGKPFVFQEVIDLYGSEPIRSEHYVHLGQVTEFKYGLKLGEVFKSSQSALTHLANFGSAWGMLDDGDALVFVDNHDNQRGHGGGGNIITYKSPNEYKMAVIFMLSWPYGTPRVMSSYDFPEDWTGPPQGSPGTGTTCQNGWICEHRWRQIMNMVAWRNSAGNSQVSNWWSNGNNQVSFTRGEAFIAFNKQDGNLNTRLQTGLPQGQYCDVISGDVIDGGCTGLTINVGSDSKADISLNGYQEDPIIAIHIGSKVGRGSGGDGGDSGDGVVPSTPPLVTQAPPTGMQRTVVFIYKTTRPGQDLFLRGGCGGSCSIPLSYKPKSGSHFESYNTWASGDSQLDWIGTESSQGIFEGRNADGSPMAWTSNLQSSSAFDSLNTYGEHYWMWDAYVDCSSTDGGWFEVKGYLDGQWESDISQSYCSGNGASVRAAKKFRINSSNHVARCGYVNVFEWSGSSCTIKTF